MIGAGKQPPKKGGNREMAQETKQELKREYRIYEVGAPGKVIGKCAVCNKEIREHTHNKSAWPTQNVRVFFCSECEVDQSLIGVNQNNGAQAATALAATTPTKKPEEPVTHEPLLTIPSKPQPIVGKSKGSRKDRKQAKAKQLVGAS